MIKFQFSHTKNLMKNAIANTIYFSTKLTLALTMDRKPTIDYQNKKVDTNFSPISF